MFVQAKTETSLLALGIASLFFPLLSLSSVRALRPSSNRGREILSRRLSKSLVIDDDDASYLSFSDSTTIFPHLKRPPYLALITERSSCDSDAHVQAALTALYAAVSTNQVDLVSVRVNVPETGISPRQHKARLIQMVKQLLEWSSSISYHSFRVVVSSDWIEPEILQTGVHGIHFKETHREKIPPARQLYERLHPGQALLVGTSTHTVESAVDAWERYRPDYFFAGTCFETESHPEKRGDDLEGPAFPAEVCRALDDLLFLPKQERPAVLAIGGLDASNCRDQVTRGYYVPDSNADGIATIRAVLQAKDPGEAVRAILQSMGIPGITRS